MRASSKHANSLIAQEYLFICYCPHRIGNMPRTKPTKKLGIYGKYDLILDQAVETYEESKRQEQYYM